MAHPPRAGLSRHSLPQNRLRWQVYNCRSFRHKKLRYRGLKKNTAQLHTLFALANLVIAKKALLVPKSAY